MAIMNQELIWQIPHSLRSSLTNLLKGKEETALNEPNSIVLSSSLAKKLFANKTALGQSVIWGSGKYAQNLTVKAVFDDTYRKSHLNPNYLISMSTRGIGKLYTNLW